MSDEKVKPVLEARGLVKHYGQVIALDGTDFELYPGEILAVIGDNGAGKSSLIKALAGALIPDAGQILLNGEQVHFHSPIDARRYGIETVYQDLAVAPALNVMENIFLGREIRRENWLGRFLGMLDKKRMLNHWLYAGSENRHPVDATAGGHPFWWSATGGGSGAQCCLCQQSDHPRRANRGTWRQGIAHGGRADSGGAPTRAACHSHQPQHAAGL